MSHRYNLNTLDQLTDEDIIADRLADDDGIALERELSRANARLQRKMNHALYSMNRVVEGGGRAGDKRNKPVRIPKERPE